PLYQSVELAFRCKRMFIIAILAGTVITSGFVYMRSSSYSTTLIAALAGDPEGAQENVSPTAERTPATRKTERLAFWLRKDPEFLRQVLRDVGMDQGLNEDKFDRLLKKVRNSISTPTIAN